MFLGCYPALTNYFNQINPGCHFPRPVSAVAACIWVTKKERGGRVREKQTGRERKTKRTKERDRERETDRQKTKRKTETKEKERLIMKNYK